MTRRGNMDNLTAKGIDKRIILSFRISDDNIVLRSKKGIGDLPFSREGFSGTGCT